MAHYLLCSYSDSNSARGRGQVPSASSPSSVKSARVVGGIRMRTPKKLGIRGQAAIGSSLLLAALCTAPAFAADSPIAKAARSDDLATVKQLIGSRADVNLPATDGSTALLWAAYNSDLEMVKTLTAAHANANVANKYGVTPLIQASRTGDAAIVKALLDGGADVALAHPEGETPLMAAAQAGNVEAVELLLASGAKPNAQESFQQQTALMWAAAEGHTAVVDALLKAGADPNLQAHVNLLKDRKNADYPSGGFTALMWAARNGHEDIVRRLAAAGADFNARNGDGATAMMITVVNDRFDLAATLLELGADANDGSLYHAVEMRDATTDWYAHDGSKLRNNFANQRTALDLIALFLDKGADPNKPFVGQMHSAAMCCDPFANASPFYRAAVAADVEALKLLIAHGANLEWTPTNAESGGPGANANVGKTRAHGRDQRRQGRAVVRRSRLLARRSAAVPRAVESHTGRRRALADRFRRERQRRRARRCHGAAQGRRSAQSRHAARAHRRRRGSQGQERRRAHRAPARARSSSRTTRRRIRSARRRARTAPRPKKSSRCCATRRRSRPSSPTRPRTRTRRDEAIDLRCGRLRRRGDRGGRRRVRLVEARARSRARRALGDARQVLRRLPQRRRAHRRSLVRAPASPTASCRTRASGKPRSRSCASA